MTANTLKITFKQREEHRDAAERRLERAQAGDSDDAVEQDARFILNFEEYGDIERLMRERNLKLIEAIVEHRPESIQDAATVVDRDYRDVHRNLEELESLGVVEFEADGQRKQPRLRDGAEHIDFSIQFPGHTTADAGASAD